jgi:hypothetical protein
MSNRKRAASEDTIVQVEAELNPTHEAKDKEGASFLPSEVILEQGYVAQAPSGEKQKPTREAYLSVVACFLGEIAGRPLRDCQSLTRNV